MVGQHVMISPRGFRAQVYSNNALTFLNFPKLTSIGGRLFVSCSVPHRNYGASHVPVACVMAPLLGLWPRGGPSRARLGAAALSWVLAGGLAFA
jgi:hypothetical protein